MWIAGILVLSCFAVGWAEPKVTLMDDQPFLSVPLSHTANLECCFAVSGEKSLKSYWVKSSKLEQKMLGPLAVNLSERATVGEATASRCGTLTLKSVQLQDSGLYQCLLNHSSVRLLSHGTYLHVYKPLVKTLNLKESTKNKILTAEGILLFLCVLLPSAMVLCKSKKLNELEKKKAQREEENIYQGLNLDDCCATYDQIERSQGRGLYQDVCPMTEEEEEGEGDMPLERP